MHIAQILPVDRPQPAALARIASTVALVLAILAIGLAAGFFYAYEVSVTRGLAIVDDRTYVETMQAINATVRNAPFALSFFGAPLLACTALLLRLGRRRSPSTWLVAAGFVLYAVGVFAVTFAVSVPLNEELARYTDLDAVDLAAVRADYEPDWNAWNRVRTGAALASLAALVAALLLESRRSRS